MSLNLKKVGKSQPTVEAEGEEGKPAANQEKSEKSPF